MKSPDDNGTEATDVKLRIGDWTVVPSLNRIERPKRHETLQYLTMQVLVYLAERQGQVVSHQEILDTLWKGRVTGEYSVHRRIADLRRAFDDDAKNPKYIETIPKRGYRLIATVDRFTGHEPVVRRRGWVMPTAFALLAFVLIWSLYITTRNNEPDVTPVAEPIAVRLESEPNNAAVSIMPYGAPDAEWEPFGITPFEAELPPGAYRLRFRADAHETVELAVPNPGRILNNFGRGYFTVTLPPAGSVNEGMVYVPAVPALVPIRGYGAFRDVGEFQIGRTEVSNAEYAEFVGAGGYTNPDYWRDFLESPDALPFDGVVSRFVDASGEPGPAQWANGAPPANAENLPVTGVSWYEAMAYARFRDATLPTASQWARAALALAEHRRPLAPALVPEAHLEGNAPIPVDAGNAISTWGAINVVGNVWEWTRTPMAGGRYSLGGSYRGPEWRYAAPNHAHPMERRPDQGLRIARYDDSAAPESIEVPVEPPEMPDVDEAAFAQLTEPLRYEPGSLDASTVTIVSETEEDGWILRKVLVPTRDPDDPMPVLIFLPKASEGPLQPVLFIPPYDSFTTPRPSAAKNIIDYQVDFVVASGRALIWPIYMGSNERFNDKKLGTREEVLMSWQMVWQARNNEIGRVIDYLDAAPDFDADRVGLITISFGSSYVAPYFLAVESRIKTAVLIASSLATVDPQRTPLNLNPNTYWPYITTPVLALNGRYDIMQKYRPEFAALIETLATPEEDKRAVFYNATHWPLPIHRVRNDALAWLDEYLGTVD